MGSRIGQFRIERELGHGGAGVVYIAHDTKLDRKVAIKCISPEVINNPVAQSRDFWSLSQFAQSIPEWDNQQVRISFEDDATLTKDGCHFLDGHQEEFFLIR